MDLGVGVGYKQAAPPELDFDDDHFSTNRSPLQGLVTFRTYYFKTFGSNLFRWND
jgi:hypothetical protein